MEDNQQIQDPSVKGIRGLKGLEGINRLKEKGANITSSDIPGDYRSMMKTIYQNAVPRQNIGFAGINDSRLDKEITSASQLYDLANTRGELQPWYSQVANGIAKGAVLAGTTFLDGTIGLVTGIGQAITEQRLSALWDNPYSKALQSVNEWSEKVLPNYYTNEELEQPWHKNIFTANFLGDKFIKNLGFTVGAFYTGKISAAALSPLKKVMGMVKGVSNLPTFITSGVGASISAINEGRIEALNNSKDWFEYEAQKLSDDHNRNLERLKNLYGDKEMYGYLVNIENQLYEDRVARLEENSLKMGNMDMLLNLPILLGSNLFQFAKLYSNGFKTARRMASITGKAGEYTVDKSLGKTIAKSLLKSQSEGIEEISQSAVSRTSGNYYEQDLKNFYLSQISPDTEEETVSWIKAFAKGINETVNEGSSWEEYFIGVLTGALGIPMFRNVVNDVGKFQSPITIEGGIREEINEYRENIKNSQDMVDRLNQRVQSPDFVNYYQGFKRHFKYQNDMDKSAADNNEFEFKNAEHGQLISDIVMFDNAGKIEDLKTLINNTFDISDENLESIIANTTTISENGKLAGPFAQFATVDENGSIVSNFGDAKSKKKMIDKLTQNKDDILESIEKYQKIKEDTDIRTGQNLDDEQLAVLTFIQSRIDNWEKRRNSMAKQMKGPLKNYLRAIYEQENITIDNSLKKLMNSRNSEAFSKNLTSTAVNSLLKMLSVSEENYLTPGKMLNVIELSYDMAKINEGIETYNKKLEEFLYNPQKLKETIDEDKEEVKVQAEESKKNDLKDNLSKASSVSELRDVMNATDDPGIESVINDLVVEGNKVAKEYKDMSIFERDVRTIISDIDESSDLKNEAAPIIQNHIRRSNSLSEASNTDLILSDPDLYKNDSDIPGRSDELSYIIQKAVSQTKQNDKYKDKFPSEYRKPEEKGNPPISPTDSETTGDSGTPTIPVIDGATLNKESPSLSTEPTDSYGDISDDDMHSENMQFNGTDNISYQKNNNRYYRPAIPETHIEASKEGDFRPFYEVVSEREPNTDFSVLYKYLERNNAFSYINEGNLKEGTELGFMIDPSLEEEMKNTYSWYNGPTILLIDKRNNQIVGSLDESQNSVNRYIGLADLRRKIEREFKERNDNQNKNETESVAYYTVREDSLLSKIEEIRRKDRTEYSKIPQRVIELLHENVREGKIDEIYYNELINLTKNTPLENITDDYITPVYKDRDRAQTSSDIDNSKFIATPTTKVSKIMIGKIPIGINTVDLADIPGIKDEGEPLFGIVKNGVMHTNGKINSNDIFSNLDISKREGRLYLLIPNAAGMYSPASIRVKHFNRTEFNPDNDKVKESVIYKNIKKAVDMLAAARSKRDVEDALSELKNHLYIGKKGERTFYVEWIPAEEGGGLKFTRISRDKDNKRTGKEYEKEVQFTEQNSLRGEAGTSETSMDSTARSIAVIENEIMNILLDMNLPIQINVNMINREGYNRMLLSSNVLKTDLLKAKVIGNWFTTDYIDSEGNIQAAINPVKSSKPNPIGGAESVINGTRIALNTGKVYYVDLVKDTIKDELGNIIRYDELGESGELLIDLTWAQNVYGNKTESLYMTKNIVETPDGRVLDRTSQSYLPSDKALEILNQLHTRREDNTRSDTIIMSIIEDQDKVNKEMTDQDYYYILEEDNQYHAYDRVHKKLGTNTVFSEKQKNDLEEIKVNLLKSVDTVTKYDRYLTSLSKKYNIDLSEFKGKTDVKSRNEILSRIQDSFYGSSKSRESGKYIDAFIRKFFTSNDPPVKGDNMTEQAFTDLVNSLTEIRITAEQRGERFFADNLVIFYKYPDGTRIAGELDILSVDVKGNFNIYDIKTSKHSFYPFTDKYGKQIDYFKHKAPFQKISTESYYTLQLSAYKNLFESKYGVPVTKLALLPFVLSYDNGKISDVTLEKGIPISYNPSVNVPLISSTDANSSPVSTTGASMAVQKEQAVNKYDFDSEDLEEIIKYRKIDSEAGKENKDIRIWNKEKELKWLERILPELGREDRIRIVKGLIRVKDSGALAWGQFNNGIITLSDIAAEGTVYHEAFHTVFNLLLDNNERQALLNEAKEMYGDKSDLDLEEDMAEGFREYVATRESKGLLNKIKNFFKDLWIKVVNWNRMQPHLTAYYQMINEGRYAKSNIPYTDISRNREEEYTQEMKDILVRAPRDSQGRLLAPNGRLSRLTEKQYAQVRTKAFKEWFGDWEGNPFAENVSLDDGSFSPENVDGFGYRPEFIFRQNGEYVGSFHFENLVESENGELLLDMYFLDFPEVGNSLSIEREYRNRGLGKAMYYEAAKYAARRRRTLRSATIKSISDEAKRVWESFVRNGYATFVNDRYVFNNSKLNYSKAVDKNGEPLVVYHGTNADNITAFSLEKAKHNIGIFLSKSKNVARSYVDWLNINYYGKIINDELNNFNIYESYDEYKNRVLESEKDADLPFSSLMSEEAFNAKKAAIINFDEHVYNTFVNLRNPLIVDAKKRKWNSILFKGVKNTTESLAVYAKKYGYDGVIVTDVEDNGLKNQNDIISGYEISDEYIAFNPNQIKSAISNVGTFDSNNPDIRYRRIDNTILPLSELNMFKEADKRNFDSYDSETQDMLLMKGWTQQMFDSVSQEERDHAVKCIIL